jgi:hypothetical protein
MLQIRLIYRRRRHGTFDSVRVADSENRRRNVSAERRFDLEYASDPRISRMAAGGPVQISAPIANDRQRSNLWAVGADGKNHRHDLRQP